MKRQALALIAIVSVSAAAAAQTEPRLARLEVTLWPEYDRPAVLVMMNGWLAPDVVLPATVRLPMPARAGPPHAVAKRTPDGRLLTAQHTVDVKGDWAMVEVKTDAREVRLEYYADLTRADSTRRYVFAWPGGLDVEEVAYEVMQPIGATDLSVDPPPASQSVGNDGLTYHLGDLGSKARNETFSIGISYTKATSTLTAGALEPASPVGQAPAPPAETRSGSHEVNPWLLALVIVLAAALTGTWVFRARGKPARKR